LPTTLQTEATNSQSGHQAYSYESAIDRYASQQPHHSKGSLHL